MTTAQNMPKQVYLEEAIEHVATFCQNHLENIIFPEFDPIYRTANVKGIELIITLFELFSGHIAHSLVLAYESDSITFDPTQH